MQVRVEHSGRDLILRDARREWAGGCFLLLWLCGWTVGCVFLVGIVVADPKPLHLLFALPFWSAEIFVVCLVAGMFLGRATLRLSPAGLDYEYRAVVRIDARHVPLDELRGFASSDSTMPRSEDKTSWRCLHVETAGQPLEFAAGIDEHELEWLGQLLREHLATLRHESPRPASDAPPPDSDPAVAAPIDVDQPRRAEVLRPTSRRCEQPSDSRIELLRDWEGLHFRWRGQWSLLSIGGATFVCLFWNSIVSVFVYHLFDEFNWFLFFFLIPFEAIGLLLLGGWLMAITAPAWRRQWVFLRHEIRRRTSVLGIGFTRRFSIERLDRIELLCETFGPTTASEAGSVFITGRFALSLVGPDNVEVVRIGQLTQGEARWLADEVFSHHPHWFRR
jgi:hypothetical protein